MKAWVLFLFTVVSGLSLAADWKVAYSKAYQFPYGVSSSDAIQFPSGYSALKMKVEYTGSNPCYIQAERIDIVMSGQTGPATLFADSEGIFDLPQGTLRQVVIHARSSKWSKVTCTETLYVTSSPTVDSFKYLGSASVETHSETVEFKLTAPAKVTHFRVEVPAFCQDSLLIDSAETMTEGIWDEAELTSAGDRVYEVAGGQGTRISAIRLVLEGAPEVACPINFYARVKK